MIKQEKVMDRKWAFVFPVTKAYVPEAKVLVYSLKKWHPEIPIFITVADGTTLDDFKQYGDGITIVKSPECDTEFRQIRTHRFKVAAELGEQGYNAVCIVDADMMMVSRIDPFFMMVESGAVLVCSDNTMLRYESKHFRQHFLDVPDNINVIHTGFSTVPTFVNPQIHKNLLEEIWNSKTGNDLETFNLITLLRGYMEDNVVLLNSYQWTNIHHTMLKPETYVRRSVDMHGEHFISYMGERVYMMHGHWLQNGYVDELIDPMKRNYANYPNAVFIAEESVRCLKEVYRRYAAEAGVEVPE
jgi:hypothetical protein